MLFFFESLFNNENEREQGEKTMNGKYDHIHSIHFYPFAHHAAPKIYFREAEEKWTTLFCKRSI